MIRVLRAVRPSRLSLAVTTATKRRGEQGQPALLADREQGGVGDRDRIGPGAGVGRRAKQQAEPRADQQGEQAAAARAAASSGGQGPCSRPRFAPGRARSRSTQMGEHRAAGGGMQPRVDVAVHGLDHRRDPPLPRLEPRRGSASRASGGGRSARGHGACGLSTAGPCAGIIDAVVAAEQQIEALPYRAVMSPSGGETTVVDQPMT